MKHCRLVTPPATDVCLKPATCVIVWHDDDRTFACWPCAVQMAQMAESQFGVKLRIERLEGG